MHPFTDDLIPLDATFSLDQTDAGFDLILESWSGPGRDKSGNVRPPRNPDYNQALDLLLVRLREIGAQLHAGMVDSSEMAPRPIVERMLAMPHYGYPIGLASLQDLREFRLEMGRAQRAVGRKPNATGGNNTKRIRVNFGLPNPWSASDLETFLSHGQADRETAPEGDVSGGGAGQSSVGLAALWDQYKAAHPVVRERISRQIERGPIGILVKKANQFRCQLCDALGQTWSGFNKPDGGLYVEAHHVVPVSSLHQGVLGPANVITVCPNHHRQLHFGCVNVVDAGCVFVFTIDGDQRVQVAKFRIPFSQDG